MKDIHLHQYIISIVLSWRNRIETEDKRRKALELFDLADVWGIGRHTLEKLNYYGIHTPLEFADKSESWVRSHFHKPGQQTWLELNGIPCIDTHEVKRKERADLMKAIDNLNHKYGLKTIRLCAEGAMKTRKKDGASSTNDVEKAPWKIKCEHKSQNYLTDIDNILTIEI